MSAAVEFVATDIRAVMLDGAVVTIVYSDGGQIQLGFPSHQLADEFFTGTALLPRDDRIDATARGAYIPTQVVTP